MDKMLTKVVLRQGDCYIVQSKTDAEDLQTIIENPVFRQTVHPTYNAFMIENLSQASLWYFRISVLRRAVLHRSHMALRNQW